MRDTSERSAARIASGLFARSDVHGRFYGGGGFEASVSQENKRPNKVRDQFSLQGMTAIQAYDGKTGWKVDPFGGKKDAEAMGEEELKSIVEDAEFEDPIIDYAQKGNKLELLGTDKVEGSDVYKLKLTLASNGDVRTYYIDADGDVPIKLDVKRTVRGAERDFEIVFGDYKDVNGWYVPFSFEIGAKGSSSADKAKYVWERIDANPDIPDSRFEMPAPGSHGEHRNTRSRRKRLSRLRQRRRKKPVARTVNLPATTLAPVKVDSETFAGLGARNIGSAAMSGRIAAVAGVHEGDRVTLYVGAASGGVWKSQNGGTTFKPVFDKEAVQSIGAVTIDPTNPKVVWVGTGESWMRNSVSIGDGVYKIHRRRRELDEHGAQGVRAHRENPRRPDATRTRSTCACRASSGATATSAASTGRPTAERHGPRCSRAPMRRPAAR